MLFGTTDLAARIERAECRMLADSAAAVRERRDDGSLFLNALGGGIAIYAGDGSPLNKLAGLGFGDEPLEDSALEPIERAFHELGIPVQAEVSNLADPAVAALLNRRGYVLEGFENVLGLTVPVEALPPIAAEIQVSPSGTDEIDRWVDTVVTGFLTPDTQGVPSHESFEREVLEAVIRDMASSDAVTRYRAARHDEWAGGASMRVLEGVALLTGAATLPHHRRRGVQSALLTARLRAAGELECDIAVVTTQPGSKSQENVQRQGFELLYTRAVLVKPPP